MAAQCAIALDGGRIAALENPSAAQQGFDDDHEEGEISDDDDDAEGDYAAARQCRIDSCHGASTSNGNNSTLPRTQHHSNSGTKDLEELKHDNSLETVVKLVYNVTLGNACKSVNDVCAQLCDALTILEEVQKDFNNKATKESVPSLVSKIVEKIRIVYGVYRATGDEQKPGVLKSLANLAKFYTDKLFTDEQLHELKSSLPAVKGLEEDAKTSKTNSFEDAYLPSERGTSEESTAPSTAYNYMTSSFHMSDLPSPTPSEEDKAARYGKPLISSLRTKNQDISKTTDIKREENFPKKREQDTALEQSSKRQKLEGGTGGWLEPEPNDGKPNQEIVVKKIKPRDPRRALSETTNDKHTIDSRKTNGVVVPASQKLKTLVEVVEDNNNNGFFPQPCNIPGLENIVPPVEVNGGELDIHPELQEILIDLDETERIAFLKERQRRIGEHDKMLSEKKLCLVLDLDHTLLNSAKFMEIEPEWDRFLRSAETIERGRDAKEGTRRELYRFPYMSMWTKLRPGIWRFLLRASQLYELHLYTMGNKAYATEMAKLLDPTGVLFAGRVISKGDDGEALYGDEKIARSKDLDGVLGMESAVLIIDDSARVWPHHKDNLIVVERYMYFPCSRRQFGLPGPSLLEVGHDEREADGMLASILGVIERVHEEFFSRPLPMEVDIREVLSFVQRSILGGCKIIFSRIFPVGETQPQLHPLWRIAEQFGAVCTTRMEEDVTHVVAISMGTDKSNWAMATGRFLVRPAWVEASTILYRRANEREFPVPP